MATAKGWIMRRTAIAAFLELLVGAVGAVAAFAGVNTPATGVARFILLLSAISFGVLAGKRGSRWWLVVSVLAALWAFLTLLLMTIGECGSRPRKENMASTGRESFRLRESFRGAP